MNKALMASVAAVALVGAGAAHAGGIVLTGHDNDFHFHFGPGGGVGGAAGNALTAEVNFAENSNGTISTPTAGLLVFDTPGPFSAGHAELSSALSTLGFSNLTLVDPTIAGNVTDALFDHKTFAAFAVASVTSCGGCDLTPAAIANLTAHSAAIAAFVDAGGGIAALAGATDPAAYAYVPKSATNPGGSPPTTGYLQTADGAALGLPAVNGDTTHNFFSEPGTAGLSSAYVVTERLLDAVTGTPETVACANCSTAKLVPEPGTLGLLGTGLLGLAAAWRRRRRR